MRMKSCTDPHGHQWEATDNTVRAYGVTFHGVTSTMVECTLCGEAGYRISEAEVDDLNPGQQGEELF